MRHTILLYIFIALSLAQSTFPYKAQAQTKKHRIHGQIIDAETKEALPYISVRIRNTTTGCSSDNKGAFSFMASALKDTLIISCVGYKEQRIPLNIRTKFPLKVELAPEAYNLAEVTIKPKREKRKANSKAEVLRSQPPMGVKSTVPGNAAAKPAEKEICKNGNSTEEQIRLTAARNIENPAEEAAAAEVLPPAIIKEEETGSRAAKYSVKAVSACPVWVNRSRNKPYSTPDTASTVTKAQTSVMAPPGERCRRAWSKEQRSKTPISPPKVAEVSENTWGRVSRVISQSLSRRRMGASPASSSSVTAG